MIYKSGLLGIVLVVVILYGSIDALAEKGICDTCKKWWNVEQQATVDNCDEGWCALFESGTYRCVPNSIDPDESYSCQVGGAGSDGNSGSDSW
jgi:hypothetical protein